jgi:protein-tyrosine phosphatase
MNGSPQRFEGVLNFRDVGGLRTDDARRVRQGVLFRSDTLQFLTERAVQALAQEVGLRTVIDLRLPYEVDVEGRGLLRAVPHRYLHLPFLVAGAEQPDTAVPRLDGDDPIVEHYLGYLTSSPTAVVGVVSGLAAPNALPAVVHCSAGKDRTGVAIAVVLTAVGVRREEVVDDYAAASERIAEVMMRLRTMPTYGERLDALPAEGWTSAPEFMDRFLEAVDERFGGVRAYLAARGVEDSTLTALRDGLTEPDV